MQQDLCVYAFGKPSSLSRCTFTKQTWTREVGTLNYICHTYIFYDIYWYIRDNVIHRLCSLKTWQRTHIKQNKILFKVSTEFKIYYCVSFSWNSITSIVAKLKTCQSKRARNERKILSTLNDVIFLTIFLNTYRCILIAFLCSVTYR